MSSSDKNSILIGRCLSVTSLVAQLLVAQQAAHAGTLKRVEQQSGPVLASGLWEFEVRGLNRPVSQRECVDGPRDLTTELLMGMRSCSGERLALQQDGHSWVFTADCTAHSGDKAAVSVRFTGDFRTNLLGEAKYTLTPRPGEVREERATLSARRIAACDPRKYYGPGGDDNN